MQMHASLAGGAMPFAKLAHRWDNVTSVSVGEAALHLRAQQSPSPCGGEDG